MPETPLAAESFAQPSVDSVGRLARTGAKWSVSLLVARQIINIGTTAIVSRILPASDFGMVVMVGTFTNFLLLISDMGLSWATVQKQRLEREQIDTLFWFGAIFGGTAWAVCALGSPLVAEFYKTPELVLLCLILGSSLFITGLAVQPMALLKRQIRQREVALTQTGAILVAGIVAVVFAWAGARYWSLVAQNITNALMLLAMSLYWSGYRPAFPKLSAGVLSLLKFGGYIGACNIITYIQVNLDNILIGRYCGTEELGFYSRATALRTLPAMYAAIALTDIMVPALAAMQGDRKRLENAFAKIIGVIAFIGCPIAACMGVTAEESVRLVYGLRWAPVIPLLIWLSLPALVLPLTQTIGWLFIASGKVRQMFFLSLSTLPVVAITYYAAVQWGGAIGVAMAVAMLNSIPVPLFTMYCAHSAAGMSMWRTLKTVSPVFLACLVSAAGSLAVGYVSALYGMYWLVVLALKLAVFGSLYLWITAKLIRPFPISRLEKYVRLIVR